MKNAPDLKQEALSRAMRMLDAVGAKYSIVFNERTYGLPLQAPPQRLRHGHTRRMRNDLTQYDYRNRVRNAKSGDLLVWDDVPNRVAQPLRAAATSAVTEFFGKGCVISTVKRNRSGARVEVLIVGGPSEGEAPAKVS